MTSWKKALLLMLLLLAQTLGAQQESSPAASSPANAAGDRTPTAPPVLRVADATLPVRLASVRVDVAVIGRLARSTVELTFRNANPRVLEGELQFPLLHGQEVSGFALDFDGKWRPAVPVEKVRGREVFEDVTRAQVDPALLEATQGNNYKLRVYPIPANGERKVLLTISERLPLTGDGSALLRLPLAFAGRLDSFALHVQAAGVPASSARTLRGLRGASWEERDGGATLLLHRRDYQPEPLAEVSLAAPSAPPVTFEEFAGQTYFYLEAAGRNAAPATRAKPQRLALVWDASGSGEQRDHGREFALLDAYFQALGNTRVGLTLARDTAEDGGNFVVRNGDWSALRAVLEQVTYDGATNPAAFRPGERADAVLLFSDGIGNYGAPAMPVFEVPLFAISAAAVADNDRLRHAAARSGGAFVDLLATSTTAAVTMLRSSKARLVGLRANAARELEASAPDPESGSVAIAGVLSETSALLEIDWQTPQGKVERRQVRIDAGRALAAPPLSFAAQAWARLRLGRLLAERALHRSEITRLGKQFGLVTPGTSLLVLDRVEDYARYEIAPPAELRSEYERLLAAKGEQSKRERAGHLEEVVRRFRDKQDWWERDFPKGDRLPPAKIAIGAAAPGGTASTALAERALAVATPAARPAPAPAAAMAAAPAAARQMLAKTAGGPADAARAPAAASIQLKRWAPDSSYARRLRAADEAQLYQIYRDERPDYHNSTAFFLDVADVFFERGQPQLALRILSNLAEMNLEHRHILRILAYRLVQAKRADLAAPVLERVLALAPDEPQSWRDLALALAETGAHQRAIDTLYEVVTRPWHNRFPDIELIALAEMNALIAAAPKPVNTSAIDPRLLRNLPLDLRVVLSWDADNTDIDLWVSDPNGEKCYYGNRLSYQGGAMSRDFTGGYGPEEFSLRQAKPGKYLVQAQFYGHRQQIVAGATTLSLRLYTGFGTPHEKEERITLRLRGQSETVTIGEFVVAPR